MFNGGGNICGGRSFIRIRMLVSNWNWYVIEFELVIGMLSNLNWCVIEFELVRCVEFV